MSDVQRNWAGNHPFAAVRLHHPTTVAQVQELVATSQRVRVIGARHSFNPIADTPGDLLSLEHLNRIVALDPERRTVTVEAGIRYGALGQALHHAGFALHNLASLPHISVAGACATATHGSGDSNGNLATAVSALEWVAPDGTLVALSRERDGERFRGAVVGLGALGVVVRLALDLLPTFSVRQTVYEWLPLETLAAHFAAITASGYSVSLFTNWSSDQINQVWVKQRVADGDEASAATDFFGASPATRKLHPITSLPADGCTEQLGRPGPWHERLTHFLPDAMPSSGAELQSEYFVPRQHAVAALRALDGVRAQITAILQMGEIRTIAGDDLWMSTASGGDCVAFHFTWVPDWAAVSAVLPLIEERLAPFDARPHWGKLFTLPPVQLRARYPRLSEFQALLREYDPARKFSSPFLDERLFGA